MENTDNMEIDEPNTISNISAAHMAQLALQDLEDENDDSRWNPQLFVTQNNSTNIFRSNQGNMEVEHTPSNSTTAKDGRMTLLEQAVKQQVGMNGSGEGSSAGTTTRGGSIDLEEILKAVKDAHPGKVLTEFNVQIPSLTAKKKQEYVKDPDSWTVKYVYDENANDDGELLYKAKFMDGHREEVDIMMMVGGIG